MQDKIIAAIAAYLESNNLELFQKIYANRVHSKFVQGQIDSYKLPPNQWPDDCIAFKSRREDIDFHNKQSSELIQSIATEIAAAIAPLVEAGEQDWKDAPDWANWRTVDKDGLVSFWEKEPELLGAIWLNGGKEQSIEPPDFVKSKTKRPQ